MKWLKNFDRLLEIQRNIVWPSVLEMDSKQYFPEFLKSALSKQPCERLIVSPRRQILIEGQLLLLDYGKPIDMHVVLFDDLLLITRRKKSISKKVSRITLIIILLMIDILKRIPLIQKTQNKLNSRHRYCDNLILCNLDKKINGSE